MTLGTIRKIGDMAKRKPNHYHHKCSGGGSVHWLDEWSTAAVITCQRQGMRFSTPNCENCKGSQVEAKQLRDVDIVFNAGITKLLKDVELCRMK